MTIQFDITTADQLIRAVRALARELADQAAARRSAAEAAATDFFGGYATQFNSVCAVEASDRARLANVLEDLAVQVERAKAQANEERERQEALAAWQEREAGREQLRNVNALVMMVVDTVEDVCDPRLTDSPVVPAPVSATFSVSERTHLAGDPAGGRSSADPVQLRGFTQRSSALDRELESEQSAALSSWARFVSTCSWVPIGAMTCLDGLQRYLAANASDAQWIQGIAEAFDRAGGGEVSDFDLSFVVAKDHPRSFEALLLDESLTPAQVAQTWEAMSANPRFRERRFIEANSFELASLDGVPFGVMDQAGRYALDFALDPDNPQNLEEAHRRMGLISPWKGQRESFRNDLLAIRGALEKAQEGATPGDTVQLVSFSGHGDAVTAGVSMGDLDTATSVGVLVSGMDSNVRGLHDGFDAFKQVRDGDTNMAMVSWMGYHSPAAVEVTADFRADDGAQRLASFLDGLTAQRGAGSANPVERLVTIGHSYGTNVIAEALKISKEPVDAFVSMGSSGLKPGTTAKDFRGAEIHATQAEGDPIAVNLGQKLYLPAVTANGNPASQRIDPRNLSGGLRFSSEATQGGEGVTMHNLVNPMELPFGIGDLDGIPAEKEVGYLSPNSSTVKAIYQFMRGESQ